METKQRKEEMRLDTSSNNISFDSSAPHSPTLTKETSPKKRTKQRRFGKDPIQKTKTEVRMAIQQKAIKSLHGRDQQQAFVPYYNPYPTMMGRRMDQQSLAIQSSLPYPQPIMASVNGLEQQLGLTQGFGYFPLSPTQVPIGMFQPRLTPITATSSLNSAIQTPVMNTPGSSVYGNIYSGNQMGMVSPGLSPFSGTTNISSPSPFSESHLQRSASEPGQSSRSEQKLSIFEKELLKAPLPKLKIDQGQNAANSALNMQNMAMLGGFPGTMMTPTLELFTNSPMGRRDSKYADFALPETPSKIFGPGFY